MATLAALSPSTANPVLQSLNFSTKGQEKGGSTLFPPISASKSKSKTAKGRVVSDYDTGAPENFIT